MSFAIEKTLEAINLELEKFDYGQSPANLYDPIRYFMKLGGKRVRPTLVCFGAYLFSDQFYDVIPTSLSVEIFHNFSLVHDDIMDKAPLRRGMETVHTKWNNNIAILSGDAMLVKGYQALQQTPVQYLPKALHYFNKCALEVCEGQQLDMDFETRDTVTEEEYINMIRLKTAVLLGYSLRLGAILKDADELDQQLLDDFGQNIGIGFQLQDDYLDVYGDKAKFGKQVGGDILSNKKTFLLIQALEKAQGEMKSELLSWLDKTDFDPETKVNAVMDIYTKLGIDVLAKQKMDFYFEKAFLLLEQINCDTRKKQELAAFAKWLIQREN